MRATPVPAAETRRSGPEVAQEVAGKSSAAKENLHADQAILIDEVQLLLAERRTSFAQVRTGISVALVPLSIATVFLAFSDYADLQRYRWAVLAVAAVGLCLLVVGVWLISAGLVGSRRAARTLGKLRTADTVLEQLLDVGR